MASPIPLAWRQRHIAGAIVVFGSSLALYTRTLAPGLLWGGGDFAKFQTWAYLGKIERELGVFSHPLWVILAHPFTKLPLHDPAWRANFAAAAFGAAALALLFLAAWEITQSLAGPLLATTALAVSHTFWTHAVMPKVYTLNVLLLAACVYLLLRWRRTGDVRNLYLFGFLYGLSFLNHLVMATVALGFIAFVVFTLSSRKLPGAGRLVLLTFVAFVIGLLPYGVLLVRGNGAGSIADTIFQFLRSAAAPLQGPAGLWNALKWGLALAIYQFPIVAIVGLFGLRSAWKQDRGVALLVLLGGLGTTIFLLAISVTQTGGPSVWNLHQYLLVYALFTLPLALGFKGLWSLERLRAGWRKSAIWALTVGPPILLYAIAPVVIRTFWTNVPEFRPLPGRDNFTYVLSPWKQNESGARPFGETILQSLPENAVLVADYGIWSVLRYLQVVESQRPDVELVILPGHGKQIELLLNYRDHPDLFLADTYRYYDLDEIRNQFDLLPQGPIFRLRLRTSAMSRHAI